MPASKAEPKPDKLRVSATVVMDVTVLERARAKARQHNMPFSHYLERAVRLYGLYLDKKVSVIARPL
ncbi:MAG: hypothetical protein AB1814_05615 [Thermodesulfobacteriota bacterium]